MSHGRDKIIKNKIQHKGMAVVLKLLCEGLHPSREAPHAHPYREVLALGKGSIGKFRVRVSMQRVGPGW
jgi:hypothetical protein